MSERPQFARSLVLCRMREKVSGTRYWSGYASGARLTVLVNADHKGDEDSTHILVCAQGDSTGLAPGEFGASFTLCKRWAKVSENGTEWMAGRIGLAKVAMLPIRDREPNAEDTHDLKLTQAAPKATAEAAMQPANDAPGASAPSPAPAHAARPAQPRMRLPKASRPRTPDHVRYPSRAKERAALTPVPADEVPF